MTPTAPFPVRTIILRDLRFGIPAWAILAAGFVWASWRGDLLGGALIVGLMAAAYGGPTVLVVIGASLVSAKPWVRILRRVAIQAFIVGVLSIPLPFIGMWVESVSIRETQKRGDRIAQLLKAHRESKGRYPSTLSELNAPLPRPTVHSDFGYELSRDGTDFELSFHGGGILFTRLWFRSASSARWSRD
jgi:hypothetical protein